MYYIIVYTTVTTLVLGVTTFLYKYLAEYLYSRKTLSITEFDVISVVPDDINLSNNKQSSLTLIIDKELLQNKDNTDITFITTVIEEYNKLNKDLTSDFVVDIFTNKTDNQNKFSVTKLITTTNSKVALYIPGNNDYFYNAKLAYSLKKKGYNFYAISFPNYGFTSNVNDTAFSSFNNMEFLFQYIEIILEHYNIKQIDLLLGYSTGGLISIMYANYKNSKESQFIKRCILSSPFIDWYADPINTSITGSETFLEKVVTLMGLVVPKVNIKSVIGTINLTMCQDFNEINFNPKYKSLIEIHTYPEWIRACTLAQQQIQNGKIDMKCPVDILHSDKSVYWSYSENADNSLDVDDITKYGTLISSDTTFHKINDSIHNCFIRVNIEDYLKNEIK
jgi:alpha-beta hydrolase superfamily lysophospholipase